jgi:hypothetical protein
MPTVLETVSQSLDGPALDRIAGMLGTDRATTTTAVSAALPMLVSALARNAASPDGAAAISGALQRDHDGSILDDLVGALGGGQDIGAAVSGGILRRIFGSQAPQVGASLGQQTGLDSGRMLQLLQILAPIVMGALGRRQREQQLDSDGLSDLLRGERQQVQQAAPGLGGLLTSILDGNHDGSVLDDAARLGGDLLGGFFKRGS